ncbi:type II toxin-antitoxin system VapC family toxin [Endothiovibrio diazotrophicus]
MTRVVVDASIAVKWFIPDSAGEEHRPQALTLLHAIHQGDLQLIQPPHWLAEVAAVLSRLVPERALEAITLLHALELPVEQSMESYTLASDLARQLDHHLFDTLYHAVALNHSDTTLFTADLRYLRKAEHLGKIEPLARFTG